MVALTCPFLAAAAGRHDSNNERRMTMDLNTDTTTETTTPNANWSDVTAASTEQETKREEPRSELVTDTIKVPLDERRGLVLLLANAKDSETADGLEVELDNLKEQAKAKKAEIDVVRGRIASRHAEATSGQVTIKGEWRVVDLFATNTVQYRDPKTDEIVFERPMAPYERQTSLPLGGTAASDDGDDDIDLPDFGEDDASDQDDGEDGDDVEPDSEPAEGTEITDPVGVQNGTAAAPKAAVKTRRVRNSKKS